MGQGLSGPAPLNLNGENSTIDNFQACKDYFSCDRDSIKIWNKTMCLSGEKLVDELESIVNRVFLDSEDYAYIGHKEAAKTIAEAIENGCNFNN